MILEQIRTKLPTHIIMNGNIGAEYATDIRRVPSHILQNQADRIHARIEYEKYINKVNGRPFETTDAPKLTAYEQWLREQMEEA